MITPQTITLTPAVSGVSVFVSHAGGIGNARV